jgi:hypothetical protein
VVDEVTLRTSIPRHAYSVYVEQFVASVDFLLRGDIPRAMVKELRQVVIMDLVSETVSRGDEYIFEETFFILGDVCKPTASCQYRAMLYYSKSTCRHISKTNYTRQLKVTGIG